LLTVFVPQVNDQVASLLVAQLLFLEAENPELPIFMYINSPGGSVSAGLAVYDTMQYIHSPVNTLCIGQACSMGAFLLTAGKAGKRIALPNARVMIHQPSGGISVRQPQPTAPAFILKCNNNAQGQASDIAIHAEEILKVRHTLNQLMSLHTKQPLEAIEKAVERDKYMSADEAKAFGLIDMVVDRRAIAKPPPQQLGSSSSRPAEPAANPSPAST